MTHRYGISGGVPLANLSAHASNEGFQLLVRAVHVNANGKLTLPVRELWAGNQDAMGDLSYLVYSANSIEDGEENRVMIEEANDCLSMWGEPWLRSLEPCSPFGVAGMETWYVTSLVKADRWFNFVERRLHCGCAAGSYIYHFNPTKPLGLKGQCLDCGKWYCLRCGDESGLTWGTINVHGQRGYCQNVVDHKDWQRQQQYLGTREEDQQLYPRCHVYTEEKADDLLSSCLGCGTAFCFECGLQREGNPGLESLMCPGMESDSDSD